MLYYNANKRNIQQLTIAGLPNTEQQLPRKQQLSNTKLWHTGL